jgi:YaiO family outer membrane protein
MKHLLTVLLFLAGTVPTAMATNSVDIQSLSTDELYAQARTLAFDGKRVEARELLTTVLERSPDYYEVRVFLGRVYAWDEDYANARAALERVLREQPAHTEARLALVDVELWADRDNEAVAQADLGLGHAPGNTELLYRKARAQMNLRDYTTAQQTAELALASAPGRSDLRRLYYRILDEVLPNKVQVGYGYEGYDDIDDWQRSMLDYRRATKIGSFIGRVNWAKQFDETGTQFEIDAYPGLFQQTYAYLNVGYSDSDVFPDWRYGAEIYHNFPKSWEASLGARHLDFGTSDVTIYTGSIAKYFGNWWIALRPNHTPDDTGDDSTSAGVQLRRFLRGRYEFVELNVRGGLSKPDNAPITEVRDQVDGLVRLELNKRITRSVLLNTAGGVRRQVLDSGAERDSWFLAVGFEHLF